MNLKPWLAELETIAVETRAALPFAMIGIPERLVTLIPQDVRTYTTEIHLPGVSPNTGYFNPWALTTSLLFYNPSRTPDITTVIQHMPDLLDEMKSTSLPDVLFFSSQETVDVKAKVVSWKMLRSQYERLVREEWTLIVHFVVQSHLVGASKFVAQIYEFC